MNSKKGISTALMQIYCGGKSGEGQQNSPIDKEHTRKVLKGSRLFFFKVTRFHFMNLKTIVKQSCLQRNTTKQRYQGILQSRDTECQVMDDKTVDDET